MSFVLGLRALGYDKVITRTDHIEVSNLTFFTNIMSAKVLFGYYLNDEGVELRNMSIIESSDMSHPSDVIELKTVAKVIFHNSYFYGGNDLSVFQEQSGLSIVTAEAVINIGPGEVDGLVKVKIDSLDQLIW
jgi:hypothetical protein